MNQTPTPPPLPPQLQRSNIIDRDQQKNGGIGPTESSLLNVRSEGSASCGSAGSSKLGLDITGTGIKSSMMEMKANRIDVTLNSKNKIHKIKPQGCFTYEWEWEVLKFDKVFPMLRSIGTKSLKSAKMELGSEIGVKSDWCLKLSETNGKLSWYICLNRIMKGQRLASKIPTAFTVKIVNESGRVLMEKPREFQEFEEHQGFGWNEFKDLQSLYTQKDIFLADNTLRVRIVFEMFAEPKLYELEKEKQQLQDFAKIVTTDLNRLRTATGTADVHLDCEGRVFPVHKLILSARSDAFDRMFKATLPKPTNSMNRRSATAGGDNPPDGEQTVTIVAIPDIDSNIMEIILDYMYSGNVKKLLSNPGIISGIIRAADKFELGDLKSYCFKALLNFISEDNVGKFAILSYLHKAEKDVRMHINDYCLRNLEALMKKKSFRDALKKEPDAFFPDECC